MQNDLNNLLRETTEFLDQKWRFLPKEARDLALDALITRYLLDDLSNNGLTQDNISYLTKNENFHSIYAPDICSLVNYMTQYVRERSSGGCVLNHLYVSIIDYKNLLRERNLHNVKELTILKVRILPSNVLNSGDCLGVGRSKFSCVPSNQLFFYGCIENPPESV